MTVASHSLSLLDTVSLALSVLTAVLLVRLQLTMLDEFGNVAVIPAGALSVVLTQGTSTFAAEIVQDADGNYFAQVVVETANIPVTVTAQLNGQVLPGSGFSLDTTNGAPSAEGSVPTGSGTTGIPTPAGTTQTISVAPQDAFGNAIPNAPGFSVTVSFDPPNIPSVTVTTPDANGLYTVDYIPTVAGTYTMIVTVTDPSGVSVQTPYTIVVNAGALLPSATVPSQVTGARPSPVVAGSPAVILVQLSDQYSNALTTGTAGTVVHFFMTLVSLVQTHTTVARRTTVSNESAVLALPGSVSEAVLERRRLLAIAASEEAGLSEEAEFSLMRSLLQSTASPATGVPAYLLSTKTGQIVDAGISNLGVVTATYSPTRAGTYALEIEVRQPTNPRACLCCPYSLHVSPSSVLQPCLDLPHEWGSPAATLQCRRSARPFSDGPRLPSSCDVNTPLVSWQLRNYIGQRRMNSPIRLWRVLKDALFVGIERLALLAPGERSDAGHDFPNPLRVHPNCGVGRDGLRCGLQRVRPWSHLRTSRPGGKLRGVTKGSVLQHPHRWQHC